MEVVFFGTTIAILPFENRRLFGGPPGCGVILAKLLLKVGERVRVRSEEGGGKFSRSSKLYAFLQGITQELFGFFHPKCCTLRPRLG